MALVFELSLNRVPLFEGDEPKLKARGLWQSTFWNCVAGILCYVLTLVTHLWIRNIAARYIGAEGIGALKIFSDTSGLLTLADMGIYSVFAQALYRPVATKNYHLELVYLAFFQRVFYCIGSVMVCFGIFAIWILPNIFPELMPIPFVRIALTLYLLSVIFPYLTMHVQADLLARQRIRVVQYIRCFCDVFSVALQFLALRSGSGLVGYSAALMAGAILYVVLLLPFAKKKAKITDKLSTNAHKKIMRNIFAGCFHKVGGAVYNFTDSFIITWISGFAATGYYDSAAVLFMAAYRMETKLTDGISGAIGNLCATRSKEDCFHIFLAMQRFACILAGIINGILLCCCEPFVKLWLGNSYVLANSVIFALAAQYYLLFVRVPVICFKDAFGLWWQDRYKPLAEAAVNLGMSIVLAHFFGMIGVVLGTIFSTVFVAMTVENHVLARYGFKCDDFAIVAPLLRHSACVVISAFISFWACKAIPSTGIGTLLIRAIVSAVISISVAVLWHWRSDDFQWMVRRVVQFYHERCRKTGIPDE